MWNEFVNPFFDAAGLPFLRVTDRNACHTGELSRLLEPYLRDRGAPAVPAPGAEVSAPNTGTPMCPKCGILMVVRAAAQGPQFYWCRNYPRCAEMRLVPGQEPGDV